MPYKTPRIFKCIKDTKYSYLEKRFKRGEIVKIYDSKDFNNFVNLFKDRAGALLIHFKEIEQVSQNKTWSSEYIIEKITRIKCAAEIRNLRSIPDHCHDKINENLLAIEKELNLIDSDEYVQKWKKQIRKEYE